MSYYPPQGGYQQQQQYPPQQYPPQQYPSQQHPPQQYPPQQYPPQQQQQQYPSSQYAPPPAYAPQQQYSAPPPQYAPQYGSQQQSGGPPPMYSHQSYRQPAPSGYQRSSLTPRPPEELARQARLSVQQVQSLYVAFVQADRDRSGTMDRAELAQFWRTNLHQEPDPRMIDWMFTLFDTDKSGSLTFNEFVLGFGAFQYEMSLLQQYGLPLDLYFSLRQSFIAWDVTRDGELNTHELRGFLNVPREIDDYNLSLMVNAIDVDRSGAVSFAEIIPLLAQLYRQQPQFYYQTWVHVRPPPVQRVYVTRSFSHNHQHHRHGPFGRRFW